MLVDLILIADPSPYNFIQVINAMDNYLWMINNHSTAMIHIRDIIITTI